MDDRRNETSGALVEVRTVLSRAETALESIKHTIDVAGKCIAFQSGVLGPAERNWPNGRVVGYIPHDCEGKTTDPRGWVKHRCWIAPEPDRDAEEMVMRLAYVIDELSDWRGKRQRRGR